MYGKRSTAPSVSTGASSVSAGAGVTYREICVPANERAASIYDQLTPASVSEKPNPSGTDISPRGRTTDTSALPSPLLTVPPAIAASRAGINESREKPPETPSRAIASANASLPLKSL